MIKVFDKMFFIGPMSLGDNFVLSGIAHHFGDRSNELHIPVNPEHYETMSTLYQDHPHIKVISTASYNHDDVRYVDDNKLGRIMRPEYLSWHIRRYRIVPMWDLQLYAHFELSYSLRYSNFRLPKHIEGAEELYQELSQGEPYILVHRYTNNHPEGIPFDLYSFRQYSNLPPIRTIEIQEGTTDNMMKYVKLIQNAQEIHVVPSSFHCLVDGIDTKAKLFFHDIREKTAMIATSQWNNYKWIMVSYPERV
jgi:hypothetical protein